MYNFICINFFSGHPQQYKFNTIVNLVDQAILLSDERFHHSNLEIVINNCYPAVINRKRKELQRKIKELQYYSKRKNEK